MSYFPNMFLLSAVLLFVQSCTVLPRLDIGSPDTEQSVIRTVIVPGVTHFQVKINSRSKQYTLTSELMSESDAKSMTSRLIDIIEARGINGPLSSTDMRITDPIDSKNTAKGSRKRIYLGRFASEVEANSTKEYLRKYGMHLTTINMANREFTAGNFDVSILKIEPKNYQGNVKSILANGFVQGTATVSEIAKQTNADAAVNGGFFAYKQEQGTPGDPAGISVVNGNLVSEEILNRPAFLIQNSPVLSFRILKDVATKINVNIDGKLIAVDGINRKLKYRFNCGYVDGKHIVQANHDVICQDDDEVVIYDQYFGDISSVLTEQNFTFWIDESQKVYFKRVDAKANFVPSGHYLIVASGYNKALLQQYLTDHSTAEVHAYLSEHGENIAMQKGMYVINGGPSLLLNGKIPFSKWAIQGWSPHLKAMGSESLDTRDEISLPKNVIKSRLDFYDSWVKQRHPRTAVGVSKSGILYVVVVYGRNPQKSDGASITEMANIMRSLGASEALNLDGGGSSVMVVKGKQTGEPSDKTGERKVADSLVFTSDNKG
jgi:exopolysaccharide biosynthesis protein